MVAMIGKEKITTAAMAAFVDLGSHSSVMPGQAQRMAGMHIYRHVDRPADLLYFFLRLEFRCWITARTRSMEHLAAISSGAIPVRACNLILFSGRYSGKMDGLLAIF